MATKRNFRKSGKTRPAVLGKPNGMIQPRVQAAGPEHFGIVAVDCAKARSKWMLCDFYGRVLIEPTEVEQPMPCAMPADIIVRWPAIDEIRCFLQRRPGDAKWQQNSRTLMTRLTPEQSSAVRETADGPIRMLDPDTNTEYVLLRADIYERVRRLFDDPTADAFLAQIESAAAAGWDDPALDVYNELDPRRT